jgi:intracellular sulfur oxidation DsrE/DsrF family protein
MAQRREFLAQLGVAAAAIAFDADEMRAASVATAGSPWDTSWLDRLAAAQYRVVFNASDIADGAAMAYASTFFDHFHEAHGTSDAQTRPVIVFRRLGTVMALNDMLWEKYAIGDDRKVSDPATNAPAKRNVFWKAAPNASPEAVSTKIETLHKRGMISLVCNIAAMNVGYSLAQKSGRDVEEVRQEVKANLVPGAILVPSGIYALIRAQNAGCAFMQGT